MKALKKGIALALVAFCSTAVATDNYPNRPVRLIDPYSPGGSTSVVSLALSKKFQEITGQSMVVEYKPGAASNIGADFVAKSAPDGYTLLIAASSLAINPSLYKSMTYDPVKDLKPIAMLVRAPNVLAVHPSLPVKTVSELIEYAKANPGKLNYGSSGNGATNHLAMELFKTLSDTKIQHVPFKGGGEAMAALVGGHVQVMFNPAASLVPQGEKGVMRLIAVGSTDPVPNLSLPTVNETLPGFESSVWFGLFAPSGTPDAIVTKLNGYVNEFLNEPSTKENFRKAGFETIGGPPSTLEKALTSDVSRWAEVIKKANVRID